MPAPVISVENLSKRYLVGHRAERTLDDRHPNFRDMLERSLRNAVRKAADIMHGRQIVQGDAVEEFWALRDVSFEVHEGEVLGIIGRNGAGKSTLLKILSRITEPSTGRITLRGRVASLLEVGTGFHPELSGRENVYLNGAILGMSRAEIRRKFDEIVAFADIEKFLDTPVKRYSSGMYVRLAFAVAAHLEPEILIVDEVLAVGDAEFQKKCLGKIDEVARGGRTVLFVSHNMQAVAALCQRAIILHRSAMTFDGPTDNAIGQYMTNQRRTAGQYWERAPGNRLGSTGFEELSVSVVGVQPEMILCCSIRVRVASVRAGSFIAVDITDPLGVPLMQAIPRELPFVPSAPGLYEYCLEIFLPPMIPGTYLLSFWIGPHYTETYELVTNALGFEIVDSPTRGRVYPQTSNHGYVIPPSRCTLVQTRHALESIL
jgi:lipopolysaccharide transport system ATP-binding protein